VHQSSHAPVLTYMKPSLLLLLGFFLMVPASLAQPTQGNRLGAVRGQVVQSDSARTPLPSATAVLRVAETSALVTGAATDSTGRFVLRNIRPGRYQLTVTFVGYAPATRDVVVAQGPVDLGVITLRDDAAALRELEVQGQVIAVQQRGDTLSFDARAFAVNRDATVEDLVRRMPGVTIENGRVQAQGEEVRQVRIDGRQLFGDDAAAALRNLPAEIVSQVQVFDQQSDQAMFTGFNDGNEQRALNIVTRTSFRNALFGRAFGGYGNEGTYSTGINANSFQGDRRFNLIAQSNNINQTSFSIEDIVGALGGPNIGGMMRMMGGGRPGGGAVMMRPGGGGGGGGFGSELSQFLGGNNSGISTTHAIAFNYSDRFSPRLEMNASYFLNANVTDAREQVFQQYVAPPLTDQTYSESGLNETRGQTHRFNARVTYTHNRRSSVILTPRINVQLRDADANQVGSAFGPQGILSSTSSQSGQKSNALTFSNDLLLRHRFETARRTVSLNLNTSLTDRTSDRTLDGINRTYMNGALAREVRQLQEISTVAQTLGWGATLTYTEPIRQNGIGELSYAYSFNQNDNDQQTLDLMGVVPTIDPTFSSTFQSGFASHRVSAGYRYQKDKLNFNTSVGLQFAEQDREQTFPTRRIQNRSYVNVLPSANVRYNFSRTRNLNVFLRAFTNQPSLTQLDDAIDNSNPLRVSRGNPNLDPEQRTSLTIRYLASQPAQGGVFVAVLNGQFTQNYIGSRTLVIARDSSITPDLVLPAGAQLSETVNAGNSFSLRGFSTIGRQIRPLKMNANINTSATWQRTPGFVNGRLSDTDNFSVGPGVTLTSTASPNVDVNLSSSTLISLVNNTLLPERNTRFLTQATRLAATFTLPRGMVLTSTATHQAYSGLDGAEPFLLWNVGVGQKFLANQAAEVRISANDLLNQNNNFRRNVTDLAVSDVTSNVLQRYVQVVLSYTVRPRMRF